MFNTSKTSDIKKINIIFAIAFLCWTLILFIIFYFNVQHLIYTNNQMALITARSHFDKDILIRKWVAMHGGVYVPPTTKSPPNPYLQHIKNRDINSTEQNITLTLLNPAYVTRQLYELARETNSIQGHITSLHPIRPENAPDDWEIKALNQFSATNREYYEVVDQNNTQYFKYMGAFLTEKACIKCHQNYKEGDIRGGISITFPYGQFMDATNKRIYSEAITYTVLWLLGLLGIFLSKFKITQYIERNNQLIIATQNLHIRDTLLENLGEGIYGVNSADKIIFINNAGCKILGYHKNDLIGKKPLDVFVKDKNSTLGDTLQQEHIKYGKDIFILKNGHEINVEYISTIMATSCMAGKVVSFQDITEKLALEEELKNLTIKDSLTNAFNRRKFDDDIATLFSKFKRKLLNIAVVIIDIDFFKNVNDTYGHLAGDAVLCSLVSYIKDNIRQYDTCYRIGGEEFCIILENVNDEFAVTLADRLRQGVKDLEIAIENEAIKITISAGISLFYEADDTYSEALLRADRALYNAKNSGRNKVVLFEGQN